MKENNPQDILKDILLRMRYDSSKTLSENKEIILEQGGYYYTPAGQLVRLPGTNNSNIPAKQIYPNITNNEYPQRADSNKMQGALAGRNIGRIVSQMPKTTPKPTMISPQNFVPTNMDNYKKELSDYTRRYQQNQNPDVEKSANERLKKIKLYVGEPQPIKPTEPIQTSAFCPEIYDKNKPYSTPWYYKNKCYFGLNGKNDSFNEYNKDLVRHNQEYSLWKEANPKLNVVGSAYNIAKEQIRERNKWRDDLSQQRDVFASYRDENDRKMAMNIFTSELEKIGYDWRAATKQNSNSLAWKTFLSFRSFWNHWGTQVVTASIAAAPETLGLSTLGALILDIGVDIFVFIIDLFDCFENPDSNESWTRLAEDLTTLVLFGSFTGIGQLLKSQIGKKGVNSFRTAVKPIWEEIKPLFINLFKYFETKSKQLGIPTYLFSWISTKIKNIYKWINSFVTSKVGTKIAPLFTQTIPIVSAFFLIIKLNESAISEVLEPLIATAVGIPIQTLREIANGQKIPSSDEVKKLSKIKLSPTIENHFKEKSNKQEVINNQSQDYGEYVQKVREETKSLAMSTSNEYLSEVINVMNGPCKEYWATLQSKNKLNLVVVVEEDNNKNKCIFTSYKVSGEENAYYIEDINANPTIVNEILDGNLKPIDCEILNKKEKT